MSQRTGSSPLRQSGPPTKLAAGWSSQASQGGLGQQTLNNRRMIAHSASRQFLVTLEVPSPSARRTPPRRGAKLSPHARTPKWDV